jgi:hypothetical protein
MPAQGRRRRRLVQELPADEREERDRLAREDRERLRREMEDKRRSR